MKKLIVFIFVLFTIPSIFAKTVHYELVARKSKINISGKKEVDFALLINGGIPAPTLEFTEGDFAEIVVKNEIPDDELSIHWHGILLPSEMDGVPYVNTPPIKTGETFTFRFLLRQHGTYWYHSHTNVQEQKGVYGAFIIHPKYEKKSYDRDIALVLSDWSDEDAKNILKNLRKDGDYYLYKKNSVRSWLGAIQNGKLGSFLYNEWTRMGGMDLSDVGYDAFLINGKKDQQQLITARAGEKIRLRVINAAASSYFYFSIGELPMKVISADGMDILPVHASEVLIGMAETYDVLFEMPDNQNYEFRATAQDGTGMASAWIGQGNKIGVPVRPPPDQYASMDHGNMDHSKMDQGSMDHSKMNHGNMDHSMGMKNKKTVKNNETKTKTIVQTLTSADIQSERPTTFEPNAKTFDVKLVLGGDMERYVWHINGKAIHQERTIEINQGDVVRFTFVNQTMMHHPMHLHGHFFRVLNKFGDFSPLKHTVDIAPHMTQTIEFMADEPGEWMLHCHNLYHLKTGMGRVIKYSSFTPSKEILNWQKLDPHKHDHLYYYGSAEAASNHGQAYFRMSQTWNQIETRIETRNTAGDNFSFKDHWEVEGDLFYRRWFNRNFNLVGGSTIFEKEVKGIAGFSYLLPFLVETNFLLNHEGKFRLDFEKKFQWTNLIYTDVDITWRPRQSKELSEDFEYEITLMYSPSWSWAAGLMLTDNSFGIGGQIQF